MNDVDMKMMDDGDRDLDTFLPPPICIRTSVDNVSLGR